MLDGLVVLEYTPVEFRDLLARSFHGAQPFSRLCWLPPTWLPGLRTLWPDLCCASADQINGGDDFLGRLGVAVGAEVLAAGLHVSSGIPITTEFDEWACPQEEPVFLFVRMPTPARFRRKPEGEETARGDKHYPTMESLW